MPSNRISSAILFGVVALAPLPFGSVEPDAIAFWCIILGLGLIAVSPRKLDRRHLLLMALAALIVFAYGFVLHEQLAERPWFAPSNGIWKEAAEALGTPIDPSVSVARNQPFFALGAPLANMLALMCSFVVCVDRQRAKQLLLVMAWSGAAYAIYGIAAYLVDPGYVLWREKTAYREVLTGTFISRNAAAVYFGSCAVLWLLLLSQRFRQHLPPGRIRAKDVLRGAVMDPPHAAVLHLTIFVVCLTAMLLTNSRAGVVLSLLAMVVAFAALFHREIPRRGSIVAVVAIGGIIVLLVLQVFGGNVSGRFDIQGLSGEGRLETYRSTLKMIADHPWFGTGLGTFAWSYPAYRSAEISLWGVWTRAHSTPLELASDLGLPLAGLIVLAWLIVLGVLVRGVQVRRRDTIIPAGALSVALLGLSHSLVDFSLQIPGYSIVVFALVGAGLASSFPRNNGNNNQRILHEHSRRLHTE